MKRWKRPGTALLLVSALIFGACGGSSTDTTTTTGPTETTTATSGDALLDELIAAGTVSVGFVQQLPFSGQSPTGDPEGICPVLTQEIMAGLGVPGMEMSAAEYADMIPGLQSKRWDIAVACLRITPERCDEVIFSDPIEGTSFSFAVEPGNPLGLATIADIAANPDLKVGALTGSTEIQRMIDNGVAEDQIIQFPEVRSAVAGLTAGRVDAALTSTLAFQQLGEPDGYELTDRVEDVPQAPAAVAFRMEDTGLQQLFNEEMDQMKESGRFDELLIEYGFLPEIPKQNNTEDLCAGIENE